MSTLVMIQKKSESIMGFPDSPYGEMFMLGLPLLTIAAVGGTVVLVVILLLLWGLHYHGVLQW